MFVQKLIELSGHQNPIFKIEPSVKPGIIFSAGNDKGVVEWSLKGMEFIKVLLPVKSSVYALHAPSFKPLLIAGERSGDAVIFDFEQQKVVNTLKHHKLPVFDIKSLEEKNELLLSSEDGSVSVWNMVSYECIYSFAVSADTVRVMAVSPDRKLIAFGSKDNLVTIYNLADYSLITKLEGHTMPVTSLQFSPDGSRLVSGSRDAQLKIWRTDNFQLEQNIAAHLFTIYDIKFHPQLPIFATASRDKSIKIWSAEDFGLLKTISREKGYESHRLSVNTICWDPGTNYLLSAGDDKLIMVWEIKDQA